MLSILILACGQPDSLPLGDSGEPRPFVPMDGLTDPPDVTTARLCAESADPDAAADPIFIDCALESGLLAGERPEPTGELVVMAYNLERGQRLDEILAWLGESAPQADVLLLSELDRGCARTGGRHVTWEVAAALGMDFVYAVEFLEVRGEGGAVVEACEHGNAVLSRWPMGNVTAYRHSENVSWYTPPESRGDAWATRLGGRIAVAADILVGDQIVHLTSVHLASGVFDQAVRAAQAAETVARNADAPGPVIIGGDTNAGLYVADLRSGEDNDTVTQAWLAAGYADAHEGLPTDARVTAPAYGFVLDLIFGRGVRFSEPAICSTEACGALSDHYPVWVTAEVSVQ